MAKKKLKFNSNPLLSGPSFVSRAKSGSPYRELNIEDIDIDPDQPRRLFNPEKLGELSDSIKQYGVMSPILVRVSNGGTYRLISGERRLRAAKLAGLKSIPVVVDQGPEEDETNLPKQLVENLQREDLTIMERAIAVGQLRDSHKWSIREIAQKLGVSKGFVQRSLEVLDLPDDLQAALISGAAETKILVLARIGDRDLRAKFLSQLEDFTRAQLESEVDRVLALIEGNGELYHGGTGQASRKRKSRLSAEDERIVTDLQEKLSAKVYLIRKKNNPEHGRIMVEFYSNNDLSEIYRRLFGYTS